MFVVGVGGSSLVIGSIPIGAGTMVLRCFLLLLALTGKRASNNSGRVLEDPELD